MVGIMGFCCHGPGSVLSLRTEIPQVTGPKKIFFSRRQFIQGGAGKCFVFLIN